MLLLDLIHHVTTPVAHLGGIDNAWHELAWHTHINWSLLAQQFETDVFRDTRNSIQHFIDSGQVWALLIGIIIGYVIRGLTSYG